MRAPGDTSAADSRRAGTHHAETESTRMRPLEHAHPKPPRGRDAVVEALMASAAEIFAERGTEGASVREVAAAAGVNHALVFRHFGSKQRLVRLVLDEQLDRLLEQFRRPGLDPATLIAVGESVADNRQLWKLLTRAVLDGEIDFVTERSFPEIAQILESIAQGMDAGVIRKDLEPRGLLAIVLAGAVGWVLLDPVLSPTVGNPGETPRRRRDLARAAFGELLGFMPAGSARLTEAEAREAEVPREAPASSFGASADPAPTGPGAGRPYGREQVRDALIAAAMELFARRGPAAVSVRQIAAEAGVNHALVFRHFGSKDGLVAAVWGRVVEDLAGRAVASPDRESFHALAEALAESETHWRLATRAILDGEFETVTSPRYGFVEAMVWAIARAQEAGMIAAQVHPRLIVAMVCSTALGWLVFHPVLVPLLGLPPADPAEHRALLRATIDRLLA